MKQPGSYRGDEPPSSFALWRIALRNRLYADPRFQEWASRIPLVRRIARSRARQLFDMVAGFTYSQTLLAALESGLVDQLRKGPSDFAAIASATGLPPDAALRLVRAATAIGLAQEAAPGWWTLGRHGAALEGNPGAQEMIRHHRVLYHDLTDPLALLQQDRAQPTNLSQFWTYATESERHGADAEAVTAYSRLMAATHAMVADQILAACDFSRHRSLLDVGGGYGAFVSAVGAKHASLHLGVFDLPPVLESAAAQGRFETLGARVSLHPGDFFRDPIPTGYDCVSLVRILHDHDDEPALALLRAIHRALVPGARLVVAEPMAQTPGAEGMGEAYFGWYLWAMRSGRPRSYHEIKAMLGEAGFREVRSVATRQPLIASLAVALA